MEIKNNSKNCTKCNIEKPLSDFRVRKDTSKGYDNRCIQCEKLYHHKEYKKNRKKFDERSDRWYKNNPERAKEMSIRQYRKDIEKSRRQIRESYQRHKERYLKEYKENKDGIRDKSKEYHLKNIERERKRQEEYYIKNKEKIRELNKKYKDKHNQRDRERRRSNPSYRIGCNLRNRMWCAVKRKKHSSFLFKLVGCTLEQLMKHIESNFKKGMSWSNYGSGSDKWHLDHIVPCKYFNLEIDLDKRICFHYLNLQPLWSIENHKKQGKIPPNSKQVIDSIIKQLFKHSQNI